MADTKISALTDGGSLASGDVLVIARSGQDYKLQMPSLATIAAVRPALSAIAVNGQRITGMADPSLSGDAATKNYVDAQIVANLPPGGLPTLAQVLSSGSDAGASTITNLGAPSGANDAATKAYVDTLQFSSHAGTTYTLVLTDAGMVVVLINANPITLTIPANASVAFPVGTQILLRQGGSGAVTIVGAVGVTVSNPYSSLVTAGANAEVKLLKIGTDAWSANGEVA